MLSFVCAAAALVSLPSLSDAVSTRQPVPIDDAAARQSTTVPVTIQLVRHAYSCENMITDCTIICIPAAGMVRDPLINDFGVKVSKGAASSYAKSNKPDLYLTSAQIRAMETALHMFPQAPKMYQVPWVKEFGPLAGEQPMSVEDQKQVLKTYDAAVKPERIDYTLAATNEKEAEGCNPVGSILGDKNPRCEADWEKFLAWFADLLVNRPPPEVKAKLDANTAITVVLVTHSMLMEKIFEDEGTAPGVDAAHVNNNQGLQAVFTLIKDTAQPVLARNTDSLWANVPGAPGWHGQCKGNPKPVPTDYVRCQDRDPTVFDILRDVCKAVN